MMNKKMQSTPNSEENLEDKEFNEESVATAEDFENKEDASSSDESVESDEIEEVEETEEETNEGDTKKGKSLLKRKKDKKEKKDPKDQKIEELQDKLIRQMAEFDNFRKRSEKEKTQMFEMGAKDIIEKILPVIDNFERGMDTLMEEEKESAFVQGIEKIYKQLVTTLEDSGVKTIEAVGKEFDPNLHNAVMHAEDEEQGENIITDEFQKGYMYRDIVVRHSMVKVVN